MDFDLHQAIAGKLEAGKLAGWLSDYLVAWHGPSEQLAAGSDGLALAGPERRHHQGLSERAL